MKNRLQFNRIPKLFREEDILSAGTTTHVSGREKAYEGISAYTTDRNFIPLIGEPIVARYIDEHGEKRAILAIGTATGKTENNITGIKYHIIDTAKLQEDVDLANENAAEALELASAATKDTADYLTILKNMIISGVGLTDGTYFDNNGRWDRDPSRVGLYDPIENSNYIEDATSFRDADDKLDKAIKKTSDDVEELSAVTKAAVESLEDLWEKTNELSAVTSDFSANTVNELNEIKSDLQELSSATESFSAASTTLFETIIEAAGLEDDERGSYPGHDETHYIKEATSLDNADVLLDAAVWNVSGMVIDLSGDTVEMVKELSAGTIQLSADTVSAINMLSANTVSAINVLSAGTIHLSADTVAAINKLSAGTIQLSANTVSAINALSASTVAAINKLSAGTIAGLEKLDDRIDELSGVTASFSSATDSKLASIIAGTGLNDGEQGAYPDHDETHYIKNATSLDNADVLLDEALWEVSGTVKSLSANTIASINNLSANTENLVHELSANTVAGFAQVNNTISELSANTISSVRELSANTIGLVRELSANTVAELEDVKETINELSSNTIAMVNKLSADTTSLIDNVIEAAGINEDGTFPHQKLHDEGATYIVSSDNLFESDLILDKTIAELSANTMATDEQLQSQIDEIGNRKVLGVSAITTTIENGKDTRVSLLINSEDDKVLTQNTLGLKANLSLEYDNNAKKIYLKGKDGVVISQVDADDFIKDGMLSAASVFTATEQDHQQYPELVVGKTYIKLLFNVDGEEPGRANPVFISAEDLVDSYSVDPESYTYIHINDYVVSLTVDEEDGLASYNYARNISGVTANIIKSTGLNSGEQGGYPDHDETHYIKNATSLDNADVLLDSAIWGVNNSVNALSGGTVSKIRELSGVTAEFSGASHELFENIIAGTGLDDAEQGGYPGHDETHYIKNATSLDNADVLLDAAVWGVNNSVNALSAGTESKIRELSGVTAEFSGTTHTLIENIIAGAGLSDGTQGGYPGHDETHIIKNATSLDNADILLDAALWEVSGSVESLSGIVSDLSGATNDVYEYVDEQIENLSGDVMTYVDEQIYWLSGDVITYIDDSIYGLSGDVITYIDNSISGLSGNVITYIDDSVENLSGSMYNYVNIQVENLSGDVINYVNDLFMDMSGYVETIEEVTAAALNDLNDKISDITLDGDHIFLGTGYTSYTGKDDDDIIVSSADSVNIAFSKVQKQILNNELVISATFNDLNDRVKKNTSGITDIYNQIESITSFTEDLSELSASVVTNKINISNLSSVTENFSAATNIKIENLSAVTTNLSSYTHNKITNLSAATTYLSSVTTNLSSITQNISSVTSNLSAITQNLSAVTYKNYNDITALSSITQNVSAITQNLSSITQNLSAYAVTNFEYYSAITKNLSSITITNITNVSGNVEDLSAVTMNLSAFTEYLSAHTLGVLTITAGGYEQGKYCPSANTTINIPTGGGGGGSSSLDHNVTLSLSGDTYGSVITDFAGNRADIGTYKKFTTGTSMANLALSEFLTILSASTNSTLTIAANANLPKLPAGGVKESQVIIHNTGNSEITITINNDNRLRFTNGNKVYIASGGIGELNALITYDGNNYTIYIITS